MDVSVQVAAGGQYKEVAASAAGRAAGRVPLVYILGATHSGSTVLAMQLARHPDVCTVGELSDVHSHDKPGYRCSCGEELAHCGFWSNVSTAMAQRGFSYSATTIETDVRNAPNRYARRLLMPMHRGPILELVRDTALFVSPATRSYLQRHQRLKAALAESVLECTGKSALVDSSKIGVHLKYYLRNPRFNVKVIWLVRDGRGVALSLMRNQRMTMQGAAYEWRRFYEEADVLLRRLDRSQWTCIHYEELCAAPERTLCELWRFIGVPPCPPSGLQSADFHVLGHSTRLNGFEKIKLNEKWRTELTAAELRAFDTVAGRQNRKLGYCAAPFQYT
jgi:hypothetical protein